ncbi:MAG: TonB-dependent receptor [Gammaproteobacteria bacterium]|nr:TonB-dependent receptor [Gammaproteobacteria bacterium]
MARKAALLLIILFINQSVIASQPSEEEALSRAFGDEDFISIATGSRQLISLAPAVASVITAEDIKAIGATDLDQVLESVPGLHVSNAPRAYSPLYTIRGIYSESNPQVLVLINDIPITNVYVGDRSQIWGGMPVNNIARIEIIRGPGSAIYGADAFAGTINIITKTASDINGTEFGGRTGSFNSQEGWMLHGGRWNDFDVAFSLEISKTDGQDQIIDVDAQTALDGLFSTNASLAPGPVNLQRKTIDTRMDISRGAWRFRAGYQGRIDIGTGAGVAQALDPEGTNDSRRINADLTHDAQIGDNWEITSQLSFFDTSAESNLILYPAGAFGGAFPDGVIGNPYVYERHTRLGISAFYHGIKNHNIRLGTGAIHNDMYKTEESKNFAPNGAPLGSVVDVSDDPSLVFIEPHDRRISYAFLQDEWQLASDWNFTGGVRYDHYSDFGGTTNPRLALVWQTRYNLTTKLLYGRAFRAPAFNELYNINNPVALGNPDLQPEKIDTYEIAFDYQHSDSLHTKLNLFRYRMTDIIRFVPDPAPATTVTAQNTGERQGNGLELEASYSVSPSLDVIGNYAYQHSTEEDTDSAVANAPQHQVYVRSDWDITSDWKASGQINWVADRERDSTDSRQPVDDYTTVDLTLRYQSGHKPWALALSAHNVFDADAREPSPAPGSIPDDLPLAGRTVYLEATYFLDGAPDN